MPKDPNTPKQPGENPDASSAKQPLTKELVQAFSNKMNTDKKYFSDTEKDQMTADFRSFVKEQYGFEVLQQLIKEGKLSDEFNSYVDKGFTLRDFLAPGEKKKTIETYTRSETNEVSSLNASCLSLYNKRKKLSDEDKLKLPIEKFFSEQGLKTKTDEDGNVTDITFSQHSHVQSIAQLNKARDTFVFDATRGSESEEKNKFENLLDTTDYDPSEKITCITMTRGLYDQIEKLNLPYTKSEQLKAIHHDIFGSKVLNNESLSALTPRLTLTGMEDALGKFFLLAERNGLSKEQLTLLKKTTVDVKQCLRYGTQSQELPAGTYDAANQSSKFSQLGKDAQKIINAVTLSDMTNNISNVVEEVDTNIDSFVAMFDMPGTMKGFFDHFKDVAKLSPSQRKTLLTLQADEKYIREQLADCTDDDERTELNNQLKENKQKIDTFNATETKVNREQLFSRIMAATEDNAKLIGKPVDHNFLQGIESILQQLKDSQRNASSLSQVQQNILMKTSVFAQLAKIKSNTPINDLGYNFDQYAQFVSDLFDLEKDSSKITMKDGQQIDLNFTKDANGKINKKIVGAPYERQTVSIDNFKDLANLRIEFELDLNNNPEAEIFVKAMTGGNKSKVIHNFFSETGLETITDSTEVTMVGPDGVSYTGYLSPSYLHTEEDSDDDYSADGKTAANTFVLYDYPADKFTTGTSQKRKAITLGDWKTPVVVNAENAKDWKITAKDKKVTLSDKHINALVWGQALGREGTIQDLRNTAFHLHEEKKIGKFNDKIQSLQSLDIIDKDYNSLDNDLSHSSEGQKESDLSTIRQTLFSDSGEGEAAPVEGKRFALVLDEVDQQGNELFHKSRISYNRTLFITIKHVISDEQGNIVSFDLEFDNGTTGITKPPKPITITKDNIQNLKDSNLFTKISYLGDKDFGKKYETTRDSLKDNKFFKSYKRGVLNGLTMKDGKFMKEKEDVSVFMAHKATTDPKDKGKKYDIQYTITPQSYGKYKVESSEYYAKDKDNKNIETYFSTVTDLAGMLLLIVDKKLTPYTKQEKVVRMSGEEGGGVVPAKEKKYCGIGSFRKNIIKGGGEKLREGFKKKWSDERDEELKFRVFNERGLFRRLDKRFGSLLERFDLNVFDDLADETEAESMQYGWKKIEAQYNHLKKFHHTHNVGQQASVEGADNPTAGASMMAHNFFESAWDDYHNNNGKVSYKKRWKVASSLLYMVDKFKDGYAKEFRQYPSGSYVKIMFGGFAYDVFLEKYKEKVAQFSKNGKQGNKIQEELALFEYNFIIDNLRGGPLQDARVRDLGWKGGALGENPNAWHFQNLYSREYANQLSTQVASARQSTDPSTGDIKDMIEGSSFNHVKQDYYNHLGAFRMKEAVNEFVALNGLAKVPSEGNEPFIGFMAGILNGAFVYHLNGDTREQVKLAARRASIPFTRFVEDKDAQEKIMALLDLATADMGDKKFSTYCKYNPQDYGPFADNKQNNERQTPSQLIIKKFEDWTKESGVKDRIVSFLHMDDMKTDDNLMNVRKNNDSTIFGHKVSPGAKNAVDELMDEHYFNPDRGANMEHYNYAPGFKHPRMMIPTVYNIFNKPQDGFKLTDHGQVLRGSLAEQANNDLSQKLHPGQEYKMAYFVNEFFRIFQGVGGIRYEESAIRKFYTDIRTVQEMKKDPHIYSRKDVTRVLWFDIIQKAYTPNEPSPEIIKVLKKYMTFFEDNLDVFNKQTVSKHLVPGDSSKTFSYIYDSGFKIDQKYIPQRERKERSLEKRRQYTRQVEELEEKTLLNDAMTKSNRNMKGTGRNNQYQSGIGQSVDSIIGSLRGEISSSIGMVGGPKIVNKNEISPITYIDNNNPYVKLKAMDKEEEKKEKDKQKITDNLSEEEILELVRRKGLT